MLIVQMSSSVGLKNPMRLDRGKFRLEYFLVDRWSCIVMKLVIYEISLKKAICHMVIREYNYSVVISYSVVSSILLLSTILFLWLSCSESPLSL